MRDYKSFSAIGVHVHDETPIDAEVHLDGHDGTPWAQVTVGSIGSGVNLTLNVWDRDSLRRLADAAAVAYHQWTKAEHHDENGSAHPVDPLIPLSEAQATVAREAGLV